MVGFSVSLVTYRTKTFDEKIFSSVLNEGQQYRIAVVDL
jgi:hypothetical protein